MVLPKVAQRSQKVVDAILRVHSADVAENGFPGVSQRSIGVDELDAVQVRSVADHEHLLRIDVAALDVDRLVTLVGRDENVGQLDRQRLEQLESARDEATACLVARAIKLRRKIVMVEDELLAEQLVNRADDKQCV